MPTWLRWVLVFPAALASYLGIQLLVGIQSEFLSFPDSVQDLWSQGVNSIAGPWAFVFSGARVAPSTRAFATGVTLAAIYITFTAAITALALLNPTPAGFTWWVGVSGVVGVVIVIATCFQLR